MFKIKRNSRRNLTGKETLTESQGNIPDTIPQPEKGVRRPPSSRVIKQRINNLQDIKTNSEKSLQIRNEVKTAGERLTERSTLEQQIRSICTTILKDKYRRLGETKEIVITKVLEKAMLLGSEVEQDGWKPLMEMIQSESDKVIKRNECKMKYESSLGKIQSMIDERLTKLESLR